ncbi:hypothetical protein ABPG72_021471 [Tetrahymena utriculariae]
MNGKETIICNCLLYTFIFYSAVIRLFCGSFDRNLEQKQFPTIRQKPFEIVTEIIIQLEQDNCPNDYVTFIRFDLQSLQNKYLCKDGKIYQNNLYDCLKLEDFSLQQMKFFGLNELSSGQTQKFQICGKHESFEYPESDGQLFQSDDEKDDEQKIGESHLSIEQNILNSNNESKRFLEKKSSKRPKNRSSSCSHKQKTCKYKNQVYCLDKNSKCPISNIEIFQDSSSKNIQSDQQLIQVTQNIFLQIVRESEFYQPIVELIVAEENQICSQMQQKDSQKYQEIKSNSVWCSFSNEEYRSVFYSEPKTSLTKLLEVNQIPIADELKNTLEDFKFTIFSKQNDIDYYNCIQSQEYEQYLDGINTTPLNFTNIHFSYLCFYIQIFYGSQQQSNTNWERLTNNQSFTLKEIAQKLKQLTKQTSIFLEISLTFKLAL